jgi:hypothetical protein
LKSALGLYIVDGFVELDPNVDEKGDVMVDP